jgi:hypothetical protein
MHKDALEERRETGNEKKPMVELIIEENKTMMMDPTTWTPTQESGGN